MGCFFSKKNAVSGRDEENISSHLRIRSQDNHSKYSSDNESLNRRGSTKHVIFNERRNASIPELISDIHRILLDQKKRIFNPIPENSKGTLNCKDPRSILKNRNPFLIVNGAEVMPTVDPSTATSSSMPSSTDPTQLFHFAHYNPKNGSDHQGPHIYSSLSKIKHDSRGNLTASISDVDRRLVTLNDLNEKTGFTELDHLYNKIPAKRTSLEERPDIIRRISEEYSRDSYASGLSKQRPKKSSLEVVISGTDSSMGYVCPHHQQFTGRVSNAINKVGNMLSLTEDKQENNLCELCKLEKQRTNFEYLQSSTSKFEDSRSRNASMVTAIDSPSYNPSVIAQYTAESLHNQPEAKSDKKNDTKKMLNTRSSIQDMKKKKPRNTAI